MRSRILSAAAALVLAVTGLVALTATPAQAGCSHAHPFLDGTGGYVSATDAAVRSGPHHLGSGACTVVGRAYNGYAAQYYCYTSGDTYNGWSTWTWVYVPAINRSGWVNDALLYGNGSNYPC
ncbi:hypothetical protein ACI2K4_24475 [Micromonospora sp. NPDC050397]|uniref:hypothetical protein n=1 Tax=Micromonospora sp. NPDC050397 TaxID=3364279 RepID=UPI00384BD23A